MTKVKKHYYVKPDIVWDVWCRRSDQEEPVHVERYSGERAKEYAKANARRQNEREGNTIKESLDDYDKKEE